MAVETRLGYYMYVMELKEHALRVCQPRERGYGASTVERCALALLLHYSHTLAPLSYMYM